MIHVLTVTMLPVEFYMLNATTVLLWLCQNCSHEVLLMLITLGVLCVLCSASMFVLRAALKCSVFVQCSFRLINHMIVELLPKYIRDTRSSSSASGNLPALLARSQRPLRLELDGQRLSLPQALALFPTQWDNFDSVHTTSSMPESVRSDEPSPRYTPAVTRVSTPRVGTRVPLRRSSRISRVRLPMDV